MELNNIHGQCLCGAVSLSIQTVENVVDACHCSMCRKWAGGPLLALHCKDSLEFKGESKIAKYQSSDWAERGFCQSCGTHLFYHLKGTPEYIVPVGLLDLNQPLQFKTEIFIDEKPDYYDFSNTTKKMTGEEVFAQFAPTSD